MEKKRKGSTMARRPPSYILLILSTIVQVILVRCEESVFKIQKCCAENELILEHLSECVDFELLKMNSHLYHHANTKGNPYDSKLNKTDSRPWWFPKTKSIISRKTKEKLKEFPKNLEIVFGKGQPCDSSESASMPAYMTNYDFFDDGSVIVYPNQSSGFYSTNAEIIFDPTYYCVDRLELNLGEPKEEISPTLDFSVTEDYIIMLCPCKVATCVLKCCPSKMLIDEEYLSQKEGACVKSEKDEKDWTPNYTKIESDSRDYIILHGYPNCKPGEDAVIPNQYTEDGHTIYSNGSAHIFGETHVSPSLQFCGENFIVRHDSRKIYNHLIRCYPETGIKNRESKIRRILYGVLFSVGSVFLFLTLLVHGLIPTRNNIHDKNLISQTWSLFIGYVCVAISQLGINDIPQNACIFLGFLIQYSFLAAFFWLNVLCFDISWTFSELRIVRGTPNERNHRKFFYYSIYCWISPAVISAVTAIIEFLPDIPEGLIRPEIKERCWFRNDSAAILAYFYGPIAVLLSMNVLMFLYTLYRIYQAQKDISTVIKNTNPEKQRFILYMKLLVLMGLPWIAELISWVVGGPNYYWYLTDIINLLRAVFIFAIFCCKKQVFDELKRKFGLMKRPHVRQPSIPRTSSSFFHSTQFQDLPKCTNNAVSSL